MLVSITATTTWHLSGPLGHLSKAQRMGLLSPPCSKDQGGETLGNVVLCPPDQEKRSDEGGWLPKKGEYSSSVAL